MAEKVRLMVDDSGYSENQYKAGQELSCKIITTDNGGYFVEIVPNGLSGYLVSQQQFKQGEVVTALFVCWEESLAILGKYVSATTSRSSESMTAGNWYSNVKPFRRRRSKNV